MLVAIHCQNEDLNEHHLSPGIGEGSGNPLQCSSLENPMDTGTWQATVHGVAKSWTGLSDLSTHTQYNQSKAP